MNLKNIFSALVGGVIVFVVMWAYWSDRVALCQSEAVTVAKPALQDETLADAIEHGEMVANDSAVLTELAELKRAYGETGDYWIKRREELRAQDPERAVADSKALSF